MLGVRQWRHVALGHRAFCVWRQLGNVDFAADNQGHIFMYYSRKAQMNHEQFPMQMTQNSKHNNWLEMLAGKDFPPKLLWRTPTKIHRERRRRRQQKAAKQRDNRLAQRRQRRHTATTNMYRASDKILQLHCNWSQWREGPPTADASKSDKEIKQRLHFY